MKLEQKKLELLQEQHLDDLIRLALQYEEAAETQAILAEFDSLPEDAADVDDQARQRTFDRALEKLEQLEAAQKRTQRRRWMVRFGEVAAVILVLLAIAAPIAVANIEALRTTFARFFLSDNAREGDLLLDYYAETRPEFPYIRHADAWSGLYLPTHVPEGYEVYVCHEQGNAHYLGLKNSATGDLLRLTESVEPPQAVADAAQSRWTQVGGSAASVEKTSGGDTVMTWYAGERWYRLRSGVLTEEELLEIAGSLAPFAGQEAFDRLKEGSVSGTAIPEGYAGLFFPTWIPEEYACTEMSQWGGFYTVDFFPDGRSGWSWEEIHGDVSLLDMGGGTPEEVDISGCPGILYRDGEAVTILWMNEMRMLSVRGRGVPEATLLRIARSARMIDRGSAQERIAVPQPTPTVTPAPAPEISDWPMPFVPTWCPEDCFGPYIQTPYSDKSARLVYPLESGSVLTLLVNRADIDNREYEEYCTAIRVDVNGCEGTLTFSPMGAGNLTLMWRRDDCTFLLTGDDWRADELLQLARSIRRGMPEEIAVSSAQNAQPLTETQAAPFRMFPAALTAESEVTSQDHLLSDMTSLTFRLAQTGEYATLIQFSGNAELLTEGGTSFNVTRAQMEIAGRQVTVYTPTDGGEGTAPIVLTWPEGEDWYMLLSYSCSHEALYEIVGMMEPVAAAESVPTPVPTATPEPPNLTAVPPEWEAEHFLMRVPAGYEFVSASASRALWRNAEGEEFVFEALPEDWRVEDEIARGSDSWASDINGRWAITIELFSEETFSQTWRSIFSVDGCWYAFESTLTYDFYANFVEKVE